MMNYKRSIWLVSLLLILTTDIAFAREPITLQPAGGVALCYIRTKNTDAKFDARILPHIGISALIPVEGRFSLKTGMIYEQKGWGAYSEYTDTTDHFRNEFISTIKLHTIVIPLQVCYTLSRGPLLQYTISGGMAYGFFVKAEQEMVVNTYHKERFLQTETLSWNPFIGLIPDDSRLKSSYDGTAYYLFNTALRAEAGISLRKRYFIQAFWEYTLNDISARSGNSAAMHIGYCGLSLGMNL